MDSYSQQGVVSRLGRLLPVGVTLERVSIVVRSVSRRSLPLGDFSIGVYPGRARNDGPGGKLSVSILCG